jgi:hypothetical protein
MRVLLLTVTILTVFWGQTAWAEFPDEENRLKRGGADAEMIIRKARSILASVQVLASRGIGESGTPTSACWALTVIVRYDPKAKEFLNELFQYAETTEQRLYASAGLASMDKPEAVKLAQDRITKFADDVVHTQFGCVASQSTFGLEAARITDGGASYYLFEKLPSIYRTTDVKRPTPLNISGDEIIDRGQ